MLPIDSLEAYLSRLERRPVMIRTMRELGGSASGAVALKALGLGRPLVVEYDSGGQTHRLVLRDVPRNGFGREMHSDRVAAVWLDYETFGRLPRHAQARDLVVVRGAGKLESIGDARDMLLVTEYLEGEVYADDLLRIRDQGVCTALDERRICVLARYLAAIHSRKHDDPLLWRRRLRDLVGSGEGMMGLCDSYPADGVVVGGEELLAIENTANAWRWRLKPRYHRLSQVHGDFHPFNVLFGEGEEFRVLDRSRGEFGEPGDDVSSMALNFVFFSLQRYGELAGPFRTLYELFWSTYLEESGDHEVLEVVQPWLAWRSLVLASPHWYPSIEPEVRRELLNFASAVMRDERFDWRA
jgi:aminoglycoside phosphotransferase (APT) family kinase protein